MREHFNGFCTLQPEYIEAVRSGVHFDSLIGFQPQGTPVLTSDITAAEAAQITEANRENPLGVPILASVFADYQTWRAEGGLNSEATSQVLDPERGRFDNYMRRAPLFNAPISQIDDVQAVEFLKQLKRDGVRYNPRLECKKTLSQMASYLREKKFRRGALLFQKLKVTRSADEKKARKTDRVKYYHPVNEIPLIFKAIQGTMCSGNAGIRKRAQEQFDAACTLYFGAFRLVDVKGDSAPDVGGLRWENVEWDSFKITYWNTKGGTGGKWDHKHPHPDLKPILRARHERQGCPSSGLVFSNPATGASFKRGHDWKLDRLIHDEAGIEKQEKRSMHALRHSAAVAAASGVWGKNGERGVKWTRDEVAKLLNDTSDAVKIYFDIVDESLQELSASTVSQLDSWGLTGEAKSADPNADVDVETKTVDGAGDRIRTDDVNLGKVALYH